MTNPILPNMDQFTNQTDSHKAALSSMNRMNELINQVKPGALPQNLEALLNNFQIAMQHATSQEIVAKHACFMGIQLLQEWFTGHEESDKMLEAAIHEALQYAEDPAAMQQQVNAVPAPPPLMEDPAPAPVLAEQPPETELDRALMAMQDIVDLCEEYIPNDPIYLEDNPEMLMEFEHIQNLSSKEIKTVEEAGIAIHYALKFVGDWLPEEDNDSEFENVIITAGEYEIVPSVVAEPITEPVAESTPVQEVATTEPESAATPEEATVAEPTNTPEDSFEALQAGAEAVKIPIYLEGEEDALPQIAVKTKVLLGLIQKVERAISSKTVNDIEKYIYFEFTEQRVIARAYNSHFLVETGLEAITDGTPNYQLIGEPSVEVCFLGSTLIPMVKKNMSEDLLITYNVERKSAVIESDAAEFIIFTEPGDQFPQPHRMTGDISSIMLPIDYLENMYQATLYAVSENNQRAAIMGLNHHITKTGITLTGADGYRLSRQTFDIELADEVNEEIVCVVPKESIAESLRLMNTTKEDTIEIRLSSNRIEYVLPEVTLYGRLIEQEFPDVTKMINEDMEFYIDVPHRTLKEALTFTSMFEASEGKKMLFIMNPSEDKHDAQLRIATPSSEKGKYTQDSIVSGEGEPMTIQINFKYLADAVRKFQENATIRIAYISHNAPLLIKDATAGKGNFDILLPIVSPESGMHAKINKFKVKNQFKAFKTSMFDALD